MYKRKRINLLLFAALLFGCLWAFAPEAFALQGSDSFGYHFIDSNSEGGPQYVWEDIEKEGTEFDGFDKPEIGAKNYMGSAVKIGFDFEFYGRKYNSVYFGGNGYIAFSSGTNRNYVYDGSGLPSPSSQNNMIAPFWGWNDTYS